MAEALKFTIQFVQGAVSVELYMDCRMPCVPFL